MSSENPTSNQETRRPPALSIEEVQTEVRRWMIGRENPTVIKTLADNLGVYYHEVATVDEKDNTTLISYRRAGNYPELIAGDTQIDIVYFKGPAENKDWIGGTTLSKYDAQTGRWIDC